jgi:hypothetical protein
VKVLSEFVTDDSVVVALYEFSELSLVVADLVYESVVVEMSVEVVALVSEPNELLDDVVTLAVSVVVIIGAVIDDESVLVMDSVESVVLLILSVVVIVGVEEYVIDDSVVDSPDVLMPRMK